MENLSILIFALLLALFSLSLWQCFSFYRHAKTSRNSTQLNDSKYFELKTQLQFVTSVFPIILSILLYAGYNQLESLPAKIKQDISAKLTPQIDSLRDSTKTLKMEQQKIVEQYAYLEIFYLTLKGKGTSISQSLGNSSAALNILEQRLNLLQSQTDNISNKDIVNQPIYVVPNLSFDMKGSDVQYFKFHDYKTISGNNLPEFKKPPLIISFSNYGANILICGVTTKQFNGTHWLSSDGPECKSTINDKINFSLIIFEQK